MKAGRRFLLGHDDLTDDQFATMWNTLLGEGKIGQTLLTAWIAKENLRTLLALARTAADRHQVGHARRKFLIRCAEVRQLAITVDRWWPGIEAFTAPATTAQTSVKTPRRNPTSRLQEPLPVAGS